MKFSIKYQLSPRTEGDRLTENVPIRLRVSFAGIRVDLRSGYVIDAEKWDNNNACVKVGAKNSFNQTAGEINRALTNLSSIVEEVLTRFELDNRRTPTAKEFKAAFDEAAGRKKKEVTPDFFTVFDKFVVEAGTANNWVPATYTKFSSLRKHLYAYMPQQILNQLTKEKLQGFVKYLQDAGQMNTTVSKYMSYVRWFCLCFVQLRIAKVKRGQRFQRLSTLSHFRVLFRVFYFLLLLLLSSEKVSNLDIFSSLTASTIFIYGFIAL